MARERSMIEFAQGARPVLEYWRDMGWDLRDILNAGAILWHEATPEQREAAMGKANRPPGTMPAIIPATELRVMIRQILQECLAEVTAHTPAIDDEQGAFEASEKVRRDIADQKKARQQKSPQSAARGASDT